MILAGRHRTENMKTEKVEFRPPKDFVPPESENGVFDVVCSFRANPDGSVCLTQLGDVKMPGYEDLEDEKPNKPGYGGYASKMQGAMPEQENPT